MSSGRHFQVQGNDKKLSELNSSLKIYMIIAERHTNFLAQIDSEWTLRDVVNSLISITSYTKQSYLLLHFLRTVNSLSRSFETIESVSCLRILTFKGQDF